MSFQIRPNLRTGIALAVAAAFFVTAVPAASAASIYDNMGAASDGTDAVFPGPLANSFTAGSSQLVLSSVQLLLQNLSSSVGGDIQVGLFTDFGTSSQALFASLGSLASSAISTEGLAAYSFAPAGMVTLTAGTRYWVAIESSISSPNAIQWSYSFDQSPVGVAGEYSYNLSLGGVVTNDQGAYQMAVATVPEPETYALMLAGLGLVGVWARRRQKV